MNWQTVGAWQMNQDAAVSHTGQLRFLGHEGLNMS